MMKELFNIQQYLKAPKDKYNNFGKYKYRSCESILEAVKPLLKENECTLVGSDDIVLVGNYVFLKATYVLTNKEGEKETATAFARHDDDKKGMDGSQVTGSTSSYARKYALNGLFAIDDSKDADTEENANERKAAESAELVIKALVEKVAQCNTQDELKALYNANPDYKTNDAFRNALNERFKQVS
jgi:hypothetical protein